MGKEGSTFFGPSCATSTLPRPTRWTWRCVVTRPRDGRVPYAPFAPIGLAAVWPRACGRARAVGTVPLVASSRTRTKIGNHHWICGRRGPALHDISIAIKPSQSAASLD
eukprot:scaffold19972_cov128-Isochrysis_galbana.AAC.2